MSKKLSKAERLFSMVTLGIRQIRDPYYQGFAAQLSFYFTMAIVPIIILLSQLLAFIFKSNLEEATGWLLQNTSSVISDQLEKLLTSDHGGKFTNILYVGMILWAASGAQFALMRITNYMFTEGRTTGRGYWRERFRAIVNMLFFITLLLIAFAALVFGPKIIALAGGKPELWAILRWPIATIIYFFMVSINYYIMPSKRVPYRSILPGSVFAAVGMLIITMIYTAYTNVVAAYNIVYGVLGSIAALMMWFFFLAWVLALGILFNKVWYDTSEEGIRQREDHYLH